MAAKLKYIQAKAGYKFKKKLVENLLLGSEQAISSVKYDSIDRISQTADRATYFNMSLNNLLTEQLTFNMRREGFCFNFSVGGGMVPPP